MKKQNLLKLAFTVMAMLMFTGVWAQVEEATYVDATTVPTTTYHTTGVPLGLYVRPDMAFNPGYIAPGWTLNTTSEWKWVYGTDMSVVDANMIEDWANDNYVEIAAPAQGFYTISVAERNAICADPTPVSQLVAVFPVPSISFRPADGVAWGAGCGDITGKTITLDLVSEGLVNGLISATWVLETMPVTIDGATGDPIDGVIDATTNFNWNKFTTSPQTISAVSWAMTDNGGFDDTDDGSGPDLSDLTLAASFDFTLGVGETARKWVFSLDDGINDRISRKSDYITIAGGGSTAWYSGATTSIEIYVVRAPQTGPIYHIPNTYNN